VGVMDLEEESRGFWGLFGAHFGGSGDLGYAYMRVMFLRVSAWKISIWFWLDG